ncbi:FG-GAP-like repeat-containing protein [Flavobacterium lacus]|uniref:Putative secreted protein (Por secretion system target) n=1 Tax=Flavobacterium lacus TaxID=1353778 RepID=A0A328WPC3_9FLAO|nr:FG-GAP-like repeat-containing protein [Flavobacterium lacus]RAR47135.1 putative secreted protein (Por secretion system target) [Flavobacterium lacus]
MKKITFILFLLSGIFSAVAQSTCAEPTVLNGAGLYQVEEILGTDVASPICANNGVVTNSPKSEWFSYTPSEDFTVTITTDIDENTPRVDTRFHVYTGSCGSLTCFAGDDDSGVGSNNYSSVDTFIVTANTTYLIAFDNKWTSNGFTFQLLETPYETPPGNPVTFSNMNVSSINSQYNICVVDMNGDFLDDIVGVSSSNIRIHTQNANGTFTMTDYPTTPAENMPSWSLAAGDYNRDGINDLMYGGGSGVTFMKSNESGTGFDQVSFEPYVFCQRTNFIDLNNDGHLDAFSCHDVQPNVYFLNDGTGEFDFYQSNVTPGAISLGIFPSGGNYGSIWIDYDNDGDQDLFIAKCRGGSSGAKFNELHRNNGDGTFTDVSVESNLRDPLQTWSAAWADFDNDGDMDVIVGASSFTDGGHKFMRNNGDGTFTDITEGSGWDTNTSTSIEHIAHDFNNDGFVDVMGGGSKIMYNLGDGTFTAASTGFGVSAVGDLNNDGFLDFQTGNTLRLNNGNSNNWIKLTLQGVESNRNGIGARIEIYGAWGKQIRDARSGEGFEYMSTLNIHFGIGEATAIDQVIVRWPSGVIDTFDNVEINQTLAVVEGGTLSVGDNAFTSFSVYPNPAKDVVTIKSSATSQVVSAEIYDINGKKVLASPVVNDTFSIQSLSTGTYILLAKDSEGTLSTHKLIKQ